MMIKVLLITSLIVSSFAHATPPGYELFENNREGVSRYVDNDDLEDFIAENSIDETAFIEEFNGKKAIYRPPRACAWDLVFHYKHMIGEELFNADSKQSFMLLRKLNLIDDIVLKFVVEADKARRNMPEARFINRTMSLEEDQEEKVERAFERWKTAVGVENPCRSKAYYDLHKAIKRSAQDLSESKVQKIMNLWRKEGKINDQEYMEIISFNKADVGEWKFTLSDYLNKKRYVQRNTPVGFLGTSNWVTEKRKKIKESLRQRLYANFSETQIDLMANIVKDLALRLQVTHAEVNLFIDEEVIDTIPLAPMEIYRMTIRLLRKEMLELNNTNLFQGARFTYQDVVTAAYEVGHINSAEIDEIQRLEELWNPKRTIWQKLRFWISTTVQVGAILTPPPWNFLGVLAMIVIDTYTTEGEDTFGHEYSLF